MTVLSRRKLLAKLLEMTAGKQRATATSTDAMLRLGSTQTTPLWMNPRGPRR